MPKRLLIKKLNLYTQLQVNLNFKLLEKIEKSEYFKMILGDLYNK